MRSFGFRLTALAAILWTGIGSSAWALGRHRDAVETVYVMPSSVSMPVATSYVISTSRVVPTAYAVPTTYATAYAVPTYYTTAYWLDPVVAAQPLYAETAYVRRRGLFGRRLVVERPVMAAYATSYTPTTYYSPTTVYRSTSYSVVDPTVIPSAYLAANDCPCPTSVASAAPTYSAPTGGSGSRAVRSEAEDRATMDSAVEPPPENLNPAARGGGVGGTGSTAREPETNIQPEMPDAPDTSPQTPPAPRPAVKPQPGDAKAQPEARQAPAASTGANAPKTAPPTAPATNEVDPNGLPPIAPPGETRRNSLKPSDYAMRAVPDSYRNILIGTVRSHSGGDLEEGVRIGVRQSGTGVTKEATSNAFGKFAVRLADGDWDVDVTMPSGRVYVVSRLRVSDGRIVDSYGRRVPTLEITR